MMFTELRIFENNISSPRMKRMYGLEEMDAASQTSTDAQVSGTPGLVASVLLPSQLLDPRT
jgi:hypothetical protein